MKKAEVQEGLLDLSENSSAFAALDKWQKKRVTPPPPPLLAASARLLPLSLLPCQTGDPPLRCAALAVSRWLR